MMAAQRCRGDGGVGGKDVDMRNTSTGTGHLPSRDALVIPFSSSCRQMFWGRWQEGGEEGEQAGKAAELVGKDLEMATDDITMH